MNECKKKQEGSGRQDEWERTCRKRHQKYLYACPFNPTHQSCRTLVSNKIYFLILRTDPLCPVIYISVTSFHCKFFPPSFLSTFNILKLLLLTITVNASLIIIKRFDFQLFVVSLCECLPMVWFLLDMILKFVENTNIFR